MIPKEIKELVRFFSVPVSTAFLFIFTFKETHDFLIYKNAALTAQIIGMSAAASYLTYVGPKQIVEKGGFLMQLFKMKSTVLRVYVVGGIWAFLSFTLFSFMVNSDFSPNSGWHTLVYLIYGLQYLCATASLGLFVSLAASKMQGSVTASSAGETSEETQDG